MSNVRCSYDGQWVVPSGGSAGSPDACVSESEVCPAYIRNGSFERECIKVEGQSCSFSCNNGCKRISNVTTLTCNNGTWDIEPDVLCTDCQRCSLDIPGGWIVSGNCYANSDCDYGCYFTHDKNKNVSTLTCSETTEWVYSTKTSEFASVNDLCIPRRCSSEIPNGHIVYSSSCSTPKAGSVCGVQCDIGYYNSIISRISCHASLHLNGEVEMYWSSDGTRISPHMFCINSNQCPFIALPHASLESSCTRNPGNVCSYTCNEGYRSTNQSVQPNTTCTSSSTWNKNISLVCERIICPASIPNGQIYSGCHRYPHITCYAFDCNTGFQRSQEHNSLTCNASGEWEWETYSKEKFCLSEELFCPSDIKNGRLANHCHRTEGSVCRYYCNNGCKYSYSVYYLTCKNKTWDIDTDMLCTDCHTSATTTTTASPIRCPSVIPNGYVSPSCSRSPASYCDYYCNSGCSENLYQVQCSAYGEWYSADIACYCPVANATCPYSIPNGYISGSCDYMPGSTCSVSCYSGCYTVYLTIHCDRSSQWDLDNSACHCIYSTTRTTTEESSTGNIGVFGITGIVLAICFLVFVIVGCWLYNKRVSSNSNNQCTNGQSIPRRTMTTNAVDQIVLSPYQADVVNQQTKSINLPQGPPTYSQLAFMQSDLLQQLPSYDELTAHPLSFNTDHRSTHLWPKDCSSV